MTAAFTTYRGVNCYHVGANGAYAYQTSHVEIDADGSPNAYGPHNTGLDLNANAGYPQSGWPSCLAADPKNSEQPYVQPDGPFAGFYVSKTSLEDTTRAETDPARYVPATMIPYIVLPASFYRRSGTGMLGDFVAVKNASTGQTSSAIVADIGPFNAPIGEISIALAINLGGHEPNPRSGAGAPVGTFRYVVFPRTHLSPAWPLTLPEIDLHVEAQLSAIGGWDAVDALFN